MGEHTKVLQKGKITIPANIRRKLGINEGDCIELQIIGNRLIIFPPNTVPNPTELLSGLAEGTRVAEPVKQELRRAAASRIKKKTSRTMQ